MLCLFKEILYNTVMVNHMIQLGKVIVPSYLIKHKSAYYCEGIL